MITKIRVFIICGHVTKIHSCFLFKTQMFPMMTHNSCFSNSCSFLHTLPLPCPERERRREGLYKPYGFFVGADSYFSRNRYFQQMTHNSRFSGNTMLPAKTAVSHEHVSIEFSSSLLIT